ncbi:hypothetical protein [Dyella agri]|uniref:Uncharacterized protein n=1 Tax=Dyella agri TaxID=1926869 RepID=A0ABW8KG25_9GAMM
MAFFIRFPLNCVEVDQLRAADAGKPGQCAVRTTFDTAEPGTVPASTLW